MTDNNLDIDIQDELDQGISEKSSLKDAWQGNPLLKIGAIILVVAVAIGGYITLTKPNPIDTAKSLVGDVPAAEAVKSTPGKDVTDKKYTQAIQQRNQQRAEVAAATGSSAIPTPVATAKGQGIEIPQVTSNSSSDPLQEWKRNVEARRVKSDEANADDPLENAPLQPDLVPMVQPIHPQVVMKMDPQAATALAQQMRTVIASQVPGKPKLVSVTGVPSAYAKKIEVDEAEKAATAAQATGGSAGVGGNDNSATAETEGKAAVIKVIVPAGQIAYAQLLTELNSDIPAPVLATIMSGPLTGGRALGKMTTKDEYIVITFDRIIKDDVSYKVNGIALDEATTLPAQQTSVDHHYFSRIILPAAAKFVEDYGSAVSQTGTTTTTTSGGGVATDQPKPTAKESLYKGLEGASKDIGSVIEEGSKRPLTVHIARGTTMGVLFLETVKTSSAEK
jgi:intracellular multiplication protein IcmE